MVDIIAAALVVLGLVAFLLALGGLRGLAYELADHLYDTYGADRIGRDPLDALAGLLISLLGIIIGAALIRYARPLSRMVSWGEKPIQIEIAVTKEELLCVALSLLGVAAIARAVPAIAHIGSQHMWAWPGMGRGIFSAASIAFHLLLGGFLFYAPDRVASLLSRFQRP